MPSKKRIAVISTLLLLLAGGIFKRSQSQNPKTNHVDRVLIADTQSLSDNNTKPVTKQVAYSDKPNQAFEVFGTDTSKILDARKCLEGLCVWTGIPEQYSSSRKTLVVGHNKCVNEWGVLIDTVVSFAEDTKDIKNLWDGYQDRRAYNLWADYENTLLVTVNGNTIKSNIKTLDHKDISDVLLASYREAVIDEVDKMRDTEFASKLNEALLEKYENDSLSQLDKLISKVESGIIDSVPDAKNAKVIIRIFTSKGYLDKVSFIDGNNFVTNSYMDESFGCGDEPNLSLNKAYK